LDSTGLLVLYDRDCGLCAWAARALRRLDVDRRLWLVPLQEAATRCDDVPAEGTLLETMHVRDAAGRWRTGGDAWRRIASEIPVLQPLAVATSVPPLDRLVGPAYALVARNRHRIGRLLGAAACLVPGDRR
jgi:predicted DCC family thiol-disulfide oxidoreductase YuxK